MLNTRTIPFTLLGVALAVGMVYVVWSSGAATPPVPCPGADGEVLQRNLSHTIYGTFYRVDQATSEIELLHDTEPPALIETELDHIDATTYSLVEDATATTGMSASLIVAGCDGSDTVIQVYSDDAGNGRLTDLQGTLSLGSSIRVGLLEVRSETFEIFCLERETGRVFRLEDSTGDGVPDQSVDYVPVGELPLEHAKFVSAESDGKLVVAEMGPPFGGETAVRVYRDIDGDGEVDTIENTTWGLFTSSPPVAMHFLMPADTHVAVVAPPLSTVEFWHTDAQGERISPDPAVSRLGVATADEFGNASISITGSLTVAEYYTLFDTTTGITGLPRHAAPDYSRGESMSPSQIDTENSTTVTITGRGFNTSTRVLLSYATDGELDVDLTGNVTFVSTTTLSVSVPALGEQYCGTAVIRVEDDDTPLTESEIGFAFETPN